MKKSPRLCILMDLKHVNDSGGVATTTVAFIYNPKGAGIGLWRGKDLSAQFPPPVKAPGNRKQNDAVFLALPKNNPKSSGIPWVEPALLIQLLPRRLQELGAQGSQIPQKNPNVGNGAHGCCNSRMLESLGVRGSHPPRNQTFPRADKRDWGWLPAHGKSQPNLLTWSCLQTLLPH